MVQGVPYDLFWSLNPRKLKAFEKAHRMRERKLDEHLWLMGAYAYHAIRAGVDNVLGGKKSKAEYLEKPLLYEQYMTDEEKAAHTQRLFEDLLKQQQKFESATKQGK